MGAMVAIVGALKASLKMGVRGNRVLHIQFGNVKEGKFAELQAWLKKNEAALAKHAPAGMSYRGTYGSVLGFGKYDIAQMWEMSKYGDFDRFRDHDDPTWNRLNEEFVDFFLPGMGEATLLRELSDVKIVEPKRPTK
jgi:hypothetical protein